MAAMCSLRRKRRKENEKEESRRTTKVCARRKDCNVLKVMDSFSEDDKIKWLDVLYAIREDVNKNIQRLEKYNK